MILSSFKKLKNLKTFAVLSFVSDFCLNHFSKETTNKIPFAQSIECMLTDIFNKNITKSIH